MIELKGVVANFRDETQVIDITRPGHKEREVIAGVGGWSLTLHGSGPQTMSPGDVLKWFDDVVGPSRLVRITVEPWDGKP